MDEMLRDGCYVCRRLSEISRDRILLDFPSRPRHNEQT